ncbi:MAG: ornithine carbamoyltransferase [Piscirickettsiaceae bacterium]|nr:ornithine carbamoyltransferase [Piscirickettsiaceae bacterium]
MKHFLTLKNLSPEELGCIINRAIDLKRMHKYGEIYEPLKNKVLGMIFEKSSTRTRVSFESAMIQFGGGAIFLSSNDTQLGRGETIEDSARVISSMVDAVMIRTFEHSKIETFARYSSVPVINALTDDYHPCQLLADMQTYVEHRGSIKGKMVTWIGDGNNMCHSYINAAEQFGFNLNIATPTGYEPNQSIVKSSKAHITLFSDTASAVKNVALVVTDVWASMGQEKEQNKRKRIFADFQVNHEVMSLANDDALFMHCLPAHRNEEVIDRVIDGQQSVVWDEAENRLHTQKALLEFLFQNY